MAPERRVHHILGGPVEQIATRDVWAHSRPIALMDHERKLKILAHHVLGGPVEKVEVVVVRQVGRVQHPLRRLRQQAEKRESARGRKERIKPELKGGI